jgi:hypothetical protein
VDDLTPISPSNVDSPLVNHDGKNGFELVVAPSEVSDDKRVVSSVMVPECRICLSCEDPDGDMFKPCQCALPVRRHVRNCSSQVPEPLACVR